MSRIKETKSSAALIVAVVALVAALGGGAVAGVTISNLNKKEKNQVKRISKKQAKKLDEKIALLPGPQGPEGATGAQGAKGDIGPTGPQGDPGATNVTYRESTPISVPSGAAGTAQVSCEGNERAVGGGGVLALPLDQNEGDTTIFSIPLVSNSGTPNGWIVKMRNGDPDDARDLYANVICASP